MATDSQIPLMPKKIGSINTTPSWNTSVRRKEIQCRKEGGAEDIEAVDQEGDAEQAEAGKGHLEQFFIIANENPGNRGGDDLCCNGQNNAADAHQSEAFAEQIL